MAHTSLDKLSDFVVFYCQTKGLSISPLKLQKILYYIQAWSMVRFEGEPLFEEQPEAWVNGPVYRSVYERYREMPRNMPFQKLGEEDMLVSELGKKLSELNLDPNQKEILFAVLERYATLSDEKLVLLTHTELPWNEARKGLSPIERSVNPILLSSIYNFYSSRLTHG